jgi:hypothetical protein
MNYTELDTASDILEAFRLCNNPGEEIELFESLATRPNPPVTAFVEILQKIKLQPALVLTIKAFGAITDAEVKEHLKQSDDLLVMLSEQAKSGASDLIRWASAITIDKIGFSFLAISQYLPEEPTKIAEKIMQSKRKIIIDYDDRSKGEQIITDRSDYGVFIDFWVYGSTSNLRSITAKYKGSNSRVLVEEAVNLQNVYGIKETNKLLQKSEERDYPDELTRQVFENEIFEEYSRALSSRILNANKNNKNSDVLVQNLICCLQSNNPLIRSLSALDLFGTSFYDREEEFEKRWPASVRIAEIFFNCNIRYFIHEGYGLDDLSDLELLDRLRDLQEVTELLSRDKVIQDCFKSSESIQNELNARQKRVVEIAEKERQAKIDEQKRIAKMAEEKRLAKANADAKLAEKILSISVTVIIVGLIFAYPATICINAYLHDAERMRQMPPLTVIGWGALFGPLTWLFVAFQFCMALLVGIVGGIFGYRYTDADLSNIGGGFLALIGSSIWIIIPFLISSLIDLLKEK